MTSPQVTPEATLQAAEAGQAPVAAAAIERVPGWQWRHLLGLLGGNFALALGPWSVRVADTGPVSAGFWRLLLAVPVLGVLALATRPPVRPRVPVSALALMVAAGVLFGLDLASWHLGIARTRLGNAALFGNSGSLVLMVWGIAAMGRRPRLGEWLAVPVALAGAVILMGRSLEIGARTMAGDLFCVAAGLFYVGFIVLVQRARAALGQWSLLFWSSLAGAPVLLGMALWMGEPVWPGQHGAALLHGWLPLFALALGSQIIGQGLLVYALKHFSPLVVGLALLTQPAIGVVAGWVVFGETLDWRDGLGMALVAAALVLPAAGAPRKAG